MTEADIREQFAFMTYSWKLELEPKRWFCTFSFYGDDFEAGHGCKAILVWPEPFSSKSETEDFARGFIDQQVDTFKRIGNTGFVKMVTHEGGWHRVI
jgi:hypothetical protein